MMTTLPPEADFQFNQVGNKDKLSMKLALEFGDTLGGGELEPCSWSVGLRVKARVVVLVVA